MIATMPPMGDFTKTLKAGTARAAGEKGIKRGSALTIEEACLEHLGVRNREEIEKWFEKNAENSYRLDGLDRFKSIIDDCLRENRDIHIIGDYDVDGVMSLSIMYLTLRDYISESELRSSVMPEGDSPAYRVAFRDGDFRGLTPAKLVTAGKMTSLNNEYLRLRTDPANKDIIDAIWDAANLLNEGKLTDKTSRLHFRAPYRFTEGFGLSTRMVDQIENDNSLIITVDNGTVAFDAINKAKERGMKVIVTDHHEPEYDKDGNAVLPDVELIVNPHAVEGSADYDGYCGAGLAYKISRHLLGDDNSRKYRSFAAIATIADVMELREENYAIVKNGLEELLRTDNLGMRCLLNRLNLEHISSTDVGFTIAPCINAPGRLDDQGANKAVQLFITEDKEKADKLSGYLFAKNIDRKQMTAEVKKNIDAIIAEKGMKNDVPIILYIPNISEGIVGIIAGNVTERYKTPSIVFTDGMEPGELKGSGRSPVGFMLKTVMDRCKDMMKADGCEDIIIKGGGHNGKINPVTGEQTTGGAAGISIRKDRLESFKRYFQAASKAEDFKKPTDLVEYDIELSEAEAKGALEVLDRYAPFGEGNQPIIVKIPDFQALTQSGAQDKYFRYTGAEGVRLQGPTLTAMGFGMKDKFADVIAKCKESKTDISPSFVLYGELSNNYFNGRITPQIQYKEFEFNDSKTKERENDTPFKGRLGSVVRG